MSARDTGAVLLRVSACATVAAAPLEGYLMAVHPHFAKVPAVVLAVAWSVIRVRQRRLPSPHPVHIPLAALTAVLLATSAVHLAEPFSVAYLVRWLPFLAITVILIDVAAREVPIRALLGSAVGGAAVAAVGAFHSMIALGESRASGPMEDPNDLAYVLVAALPLLVAVLPVGRRLSVPTILVALLGVVLALGVAATFSRGGGLALLAATGWLVLRREVPKRVVVASVVILGALGLAGSLLAAEELARALQEKSYIAGTNVDTRELRWEAAARMLSDNPVLGVGPGGFRTGYAAASHNAEIDEQSPVAHNMYLEVAAELGLPGLALFLGIIACAVVASEHVLRVSTDRKPMVAVQAGLLAVLVASTFLSQHYYLPLWSLIALACAADIRVREGRRGGGHAGLAGDQ
ncbi:MAG: O-antigen ligase family protein [Actinomycetota bacterium]|nr:O-antigen ligase family protein [Actinomycetota bacterium]